MGTHGPQSVVYTGVQKYNPPQAMNSQQYIIILPFCFAQYCYTRNRSGTGTATKRSYFTGKSDLFKFLVTHTILVRLRMKVEISERSSDIVGQV